MTHICLSKLTRIGSDNGLLPGWHQAIIWTNAGIFLIGPFVTNFSEILNEIYTFSFNKMHLIQENALKEKLYLVHRKYISHVVLLPHQTCLLKPWCINASPLDKMAAFSQTIYSDAFS